MIIFDPNWPLPPASWYSPHLTSWPGRSSPLHRVGGCCFSCYEQITRDLLLIKKMTSFFSGQTRSSTIESSFRRKKNCFLTQMLWFKVSYSLPLEDSSVEEDWLRNLICVFFHLTCPTVKPPHRWPTSLFDHFLTTLLPLVWPVWQKNCIETHCFDVLPTPGWRSCCEL